MLKNKVHKRVWYAYLSIHINPILRKLYLVILLCLFCNTITAQKIYVTKYKSDADKIVYVTKYKSDADLIVYQTKYKSDAKLFSGIWFYTDNRSDAHWQVYFTEYKSDAQIIVYFSKYQSDAGWIKK